MIFLEGEAWPPRRLRSLESEIPRGLAMRGGLPELDRFLGRTIRGLSAPRGGGRACGGAGRERAPAPLAAAGRLRRHGGGRGGSGGSAVEGWEPVIASAPDRPDAEQMRILSALDPETKLEVGRRQRADALALKEAWLRERHPDEDEASIPRKLRA